MKKVLNNKNLAFTLAEMMVVLALFSAISAATLPVMTAKNNMDLSDSATGGYFPDPWKENINGTLSYYNSGSALANKSAVIVGGQISDDAYALGYPQLIVKSNIIDGDTQSSQIVLTKQNDVYAYLGGRINLVSPKWRNVRDYGTIAIGYNALMPNYPVDYQAYSNIAIGSYSNFLYPAAERLEGYTYKTDNISIGDHSLAWVSMNVNNNVAIGYYSGSGGAKGLVDSTLIGYYAGAGHYPGGLPNTINNLVAIGSYAGIAPYVQEPTVAIGYYAGTNRYKSNNNVDIGLNAGRPKDYSDSNKYEGVINIGYDAGSTIEATNPGKIIAIGYRAGSNLANKRDSSDGIFIGNGAGRNSYAGSVFLPNLIPAMEGGGKVLAPKKAPGLGGNNWGEWLDDKDFISKNAGPARGTIMIGNEAGNNLSFRFSSPVVIGDGAAMRAHSATSFGVSPVIIGTSALANSGGNDENKKIKQLPAVVIGNHAGYEAYSNLTDSIMIGSYAGAYAKELKNSVCIGMNACYGASGEYDIRIAPYSNKTYGSPHYTENLRKNTSYIGYADAAFIGANRNQWPLFMSIYNTFYYPGNTTTANLIISPLSPDYTTEDWNASSIIFYAYYVYVYDSGHITAVNVSDRRLKKNIVPTKYGLNEIRNINIYEYKWKDDDETPQIGVIAQEMQKIIPESVHKMKDGYLTVESNWILFAMISAVQELDKNLVASVDKFNKYVKEYTALVSKVKILETEVKTLERENNVLANQINIAYKKAKKIEAQKRQ